MIKRSSTEYRSFLIYFFPPPALSVLSYSYQQEAGGEHCPVGRSKGKASLSPMPEVNKPKGVHISQAQILPFKFSKCLVFSFRTINSSLGSLKKFKHCFSGSVFLGKRASFVVTQKKRSKKGTPLDRVR